ncbi:MAG: peptide chain release factor N(5)-glutamine methyltransferase [Burkholderiaceae bacterium]
MRTESRDRATASGDALLAASGLPRIEARALLEAASGRERSWLIAHGDEALPAAAVERFRMLVASRKAGRPLAYLLGEREFRGRLFRVDESVLIPRPETEGLVDWALELPGPRVADLGTGSGVIAISLALERPAWEIVALDASAAALATARANAARLDAGPIDWRQGDWWAALTPGSQYDLVLSNPPYIAAGDAHLTRGDLPHEPAMALVSGRMGLDAIATIVAQAPRWLAPGGWLLLEHGHDQASAVASLMRAAGLTGITVRRDLAGLERLSGGRKPGHRI